MLSYASHLASQDTDGWPYDGYDFVVFSTVEDKHIEAMWGGRLPFYPEDLLSSLGGLDKDGLVAPGPKNPPDNPFWSSRFLLFHLRAA